ncbi:hypothetical protein CF319_g8924 [Tilletia indica]|nr:hypothetical protein CF319_g8924 [Tilletia indica]
MSSLSPSPWSSRPSLIATVVPPPANALPFLSTTTFLFPSVTSTSTSTTAAPSATTPRMYMSDERTWRPKEENTIDYIEDRLRNLGANAGEAPSHAKTVALILAGFPATLRALLGCSSIGATLDNLRAACIEWEPVWRALHSLSLPSLRRYPLLNSTSASTSVLVSNPPSTITPSSAVIASSIPGLSSSSPAITSPALQTIEPSSISKSVGASSSPSSDAFARSSDSRPQASASLVRPQRLDTLCGDLVQGLRFRAADACDATDSGTVTGGDSISALGDSSDAGFMASSSSAALHARNADRSLMSTSIPSLHDSRCPPCVFSSAVSAPPSPPCSLAVAVSPTSVSTSVLASRSPHTSEQSTSPALTSPSTLTLSSAATRAESHPGSSCSGTPPAHAAAPRFWKSAASVDVALERVQDAWFAARRDLLVGASGISSVDVRTGCAASSRPSGSAPLQTATLALQRVRDAIRVLLVGRFRSGTSGPRLAPVPATLCSSACFQQTGIRVTGDINGSWAQRCDRTVFGKTGSSETVSAPFLSSVTPESPIPAAASGLDATFSSSAFQRGTSDTSSPIHPLTLISKPSFPLPCSCMDILRFSRLGHRLERVLFHHPIDHASHPPWTFSRVFGS